MRGLDRMVLDVPADLALRASLAPAASKPALFLGDWPLVCPVSGDWRVWFRMLVSGEIVWVPVWMPALAGFVLRPHLTFLSLSSVTCQRGTIGWL